MSMVVGSLVDGALVSTGGGASVFAPALTGFNVVTFGNITFPPLTGRIQSFAAVTFGLMAVPVDWAPSPVGFPVVRFGTMALVRYTTSSRPTRIRLRGLNQVKFGNMRL